MKPFALLALALALLTTGCMAHHRSFTEMQAEHLARPGLTPADMVTLTPFKGEPFQVPKTLHGTIMTPKNDGQNLLRRRITRMCDRQPAQCPDGPAAPMLITMRRNERTARDLSAILVGSMSAAADGARARYTGSNTYHSTHTYKTSRGSKTIRTSCYYGRYHSSCTTR